MTDEEPVVPEAQEPDSEVAPEPLVDEPAAPPPPPPPPPAPEPAVVPPVEVMPAPVTDSDKLLAVLGYVFVIVAIVALFLEPYKDRPFVRLHAVQSIALWVIVGVLGWIPGVGWILSLLVFVMVLIAIIKAFGGEYYRIPVVYDVVKGFVEK